MRGGVHFFMKKEVVFSISSKENFPSKKLKDKGKPMLCRTYYSFPHTFKRKKKFLPSCTNKHEADLTTGVICALNLRIPQDQ